MKRTTSIKGAGLCGYLLASGVGALGCIGQVEATAQAPIDYMSAGTAPIASCRLTSKALTDTPEFSAYTCSDKRAEEGMTDAIPRGRICTKPIGRSLPSDDPITACGFVHIATCIDDADHLAVGDKVHREVIYTYLKPAGSQCRD